MSEQPPFRPSADLYEFWVVDYVRQEIVIVMQNGEKFTEPLPIDEVPADSQIAASVFHWEKWWVQIVTARGDTLFLMGFNPESTQQGPSLPTVYLDQNMWTTLAFAKVDPQRVRNEKEREAALELIRLASDAGVILPLSSAHMLETAALFADRRYEVGLAIAELSGGWQMRHPMDVFQHEANLGLSMHLGLDTAPADVQRPIVTTEPYAWMQNEGFGLSPVLPADGETFHRMLVAPSVLVSLLIEPEASPRGRSAFWANHHRRITAQMSGVTGKTQTRRTALRRFWNENIGFYRQAFLAESGSNDFPTFSDKDLRGLLRSTPLVSVLSEMFVRRFSDSGSPWHDNDLIDIFFLACGAAYCDYVVGETRTCMEIQQIQRSQNKPSTSFKNLSELVEALHKAGVTTDSERRSR